MFKVPVKVVRGYWVASEKVFRLKINNGKGEII